MNRNTRFHNARRSKKDEFYTQISDIENEIQYYARHFRGKTVYCNCDDPRVSNFFRHFAQMFEIYGLKRLIATCYKNQNADLFSQHRSEKAVYLEYLGDQDGNNRPDDHETEVIPMEGDGDFRSPECIELLKQADIVVTNPPFSLWREYLALLMEYEKKFLIIGHQGQVSYKDVFPLFKENKIWFGYGFKGDAAHFESRYEDHATASDRVDGMIRVSGVQWYTNLKHDKRYVKMNLWHRYRPDKYPPYENFDAIEVSKTASIPEDYAGVMGVPITFLRKYNPDQFEILGLDRYVNETHPELLVPHVKGHSNSIVNGKIKYHRIFIRNKHPRHPDEKSRH